MLYLDVTPHQDIRISGKGKAVLKLRSDNFFATKVSAFMGSVSVKDDIVKVGDCALVALFGGKQNEIFDDSSIRSSFRRPVAFLGPVSQRFLRATNSLDP